MAAPKEARASRYRAVGLALIVALAAPAAGASVFCTVAKKDVPKIFTPEMVAKLRSVGSAAISPDGKYVAYLLYIQRKPGKDDDGAAWNELHVVDQAGKSRRFVRGKSRIQEISWMPNGEGIAYLAKRFDAKHKALYMIPIDGGESRRLVKHDTGISKYAFSPDGKQVAFIATEKQDPERKKRQKKGFKAEVVEENTFHPARVWIADVTSDDDRGFDAPEEPIKHRMLDLKGSASMVAWSPAADKLVVALAPTASIDDYLMLRRLHLVDIKSGKVAAKLENPGKLGPVAFSPDGTQVAVISGESINDPAAGRLMVGSAGGGKLKDILPKFMGHVRGVVWKSARELVYVADVGVQTQVGRINADGSGHTILIEPKLKDPQDTKVFARPTISKDGKLVALVAESPKHPKDVFVLDEQSKATKRLTNTNPWLSKLPFARQEVVRYKARDGLEVEGILIHPLPSQSKAPAKAEATPKAPVIVTVHGGPESNYRNGWLTRYSWPGQLAAGRGFAVFYPNYRGSTGRGVAYSKKDQADYAGGEFNDLVDGVKALAQRGLIDEQRAGITGGSYGGFASAWGATALTKHFAASVMFVGISDHISKFGTTDIPNEMYLVHARRWPWKHWDWFRERSPIYYVEQARTPILILHGKNDTRVHPSQSMELFRYLKTIGKVPVRMVYYPGEGHGNRKSASRLDYNLRMMRWMEHYLMPGATRDKKPPSDKIELPAWTSLGAKPSKVEQGSSAKKPAKPKKP